MEELNKHRELLHRRQNVFCTYPYSDAIEQINEMKDPEKLLMIADDMINVSHYDELDHPFNYLAWRIQNHNISVPWLQTDDGNDEIVALNDRAGFIIQNTLKGLAYTIAK